MPFSEFLGNERIVLALRAMLKRERVPSAILFTGPRGVGKFTLARMFAQAANCERLTDDFCGECAHCRRISRLENIDALIEAGLRERGESADAATVERVPLIIETDPDVWALVPDPVRLNTPVARPMIRVGQLRAVQRAANFKPTGRRRVFILDGANTMRWNDADLFLKILEEPPESATLILLAPRPDSLPITIRSRCLQFHFGPVPAQQIEKFLTARTKLRAPDRTLAAQISQGSPGVALTLDLDESARLRSDLLRLIRSSIEGKNYSDIFQSTQQLAKQEKESFENILELFYSLVTDLLEFSIQAKVSQPRNPDLRKELEALSKRVDLSWAARAVESLDQLHGRLNRNVSRQLGLDAVSIAMAGR
jgi:DNA polymerase-3 subunit delta'